MEVKPSPIMPPAETQPPVQISVEHPYLKTSTQYGISSLTPLFFGPLQPEMTPKVGATLFQQPTLLTHQQILVSQTIGQGVGQPGISDQQSYFPRIMRVNPSPIMPPAETQPSVQILVSNNPAMVGRKSSLIIRHSSLSKHMLPPKYKPTSDIPKFPFFMDEENASGVLRTEVIIIPRDWVRPTAKEFPLWADSSMDRPLDFNAATNATSGQTQNVSMGSFTLPTFGKKYDFDSVANEPLVWSRDVNVSDSTILGYPRATAFGVSSNSHFGTPRLDSYSFGQQSVSMLRSKG